MHDVHFILTYSISVYSFWNGNKSHLIYQICASVDTLETRREQLTERFFRRSVLRETSCLHYLLPDKRDPAITDRLRHAKTFASFSSRTEKF